MAAEARPDPLAALRAAVEEAASRFDGDAGSRLIKAESGEADQEKSGENGA